MFGLLLDSLTIVDRRIELITNTDEEPVYTPVSTRSRFRPDLNDDRKVTIRRVPLESYIQNPIPYEIPVANEVSGMGATSYVQDDEIQPSEVEDLNSQIDILTYRARKYDLQEPVRVKPKMRAFMKQHEARQARRASKRALKDRESFDRG
jgi:hypothetical protein